MVPTWAKLKPRKNRSTTGCLCCRLRRKKCDEHRPSCLGCQRNNLLCSWPQSNPRHGNCSEGESTRSSSNFGWRHRLQRGVPTTLRDAGNEGEDDATQKADIHPNGSVDADTTSSSTPSSTLQAHLPLPPLPLLDDRDEYSEALLGHFIAETAHKVIALPIKQQDNPLLTTVLPWALSRPTILHAIKALSGSHLSYRTQNASLKQATLRSYTAATRSVKFALTSWNPADAETTIQLLAACVLLSQYEALSGNEDVTGYLHLRACREFVATCISTGVSDTHVDIFGFFLEYYTYLVIVGNITSTTYQRRKLLTSDWFIRSLSHLQTYKSFGVMVGCSSDIFEIILAIWGLEDDAQSEAQRVEIFEDLECRLLHWVPPIDDELVIKGTTPMAIVYQQAALLLLYSRELTIKETVLNQYEEWKEKTNRVVRRLFHLVMTSAQSPFATTALWPLMVLSCFLKSPSDQLDVWSAIKGSGYDMAITDRALGIFEELWKSDKSTHLDCIDNLDTLVETKGFCMS
ncbi:fungal-specific transcription factor domain-containing protein [Xylogone sp. PMI_703]|nr:fungal-specific transcription factor domain-containing protein [Xylogone sp. PMI_703]